MALKVTWGMSFLYLRIMLHDIYIGHLKLLKNCLEKQWYITWNAGCH